MVLWFTDLINVTGEVTIHRPDVSTLLSSAFMLFQTCTKLTFGLSDVFFVTVIARNTINGVGSLFFPDRILRFGKNMPQSLKRFLSNFNVVAIQNSLDWFRNTLNVRNNNKTSRCFPLIRSAISCNWFLAVAEKSFCIAIRL